MGLFNRKRRQPQPDALQPEPSTMPGTEPTLSPGHPVKVVGESYYQEALETICGRKCSQGYELAVLAELCPEPDNPYDKNAVAVIISERKVGHLSRDAAVDYRDAIERARRQHGIATCPATITGGWDRGGGDTGKFGVVLQFSAR